jgi:DNA-binding transcriptional LysR family regulator
VLVGTPAYWEKLGRVETIDDVAAGIMLEDPQTPLHWSDFAEAHGHAALQPRHITRFEYYTLVIRAALAGQGMALIPRFLISDELAAGRLLNPGRLGYTSDFGYWFTYNSKTASNSPMSIFAKWLCDERAKMGSELLM